MARIALNGLGRIGKLVLRDLIARPGDCEIVLLNDAGGDTATHAHLLQFDTVHGRWDETVEAREGALAIGGGEIALGHEADPARLPLGEMGVDLVLDCTGAFKSREKVAPYYAGGARKVVISAPVEEALNIVYGVNHDAFAGERHDLVTAASCTTNCLAPVVKVMHETFGIRHGSITTIHDVTNSQVIVDRPHKDLRRARSGLNAMIPTSTGSATAITYIYPELKGRLDGHAVRVPLLNASLTDCVFELERAVEVEEVNGAFRAAAEGALRGVLGFETRPLVSTDFRGDPRSAIVDGPMTMVVDGTQVKIYAWYDNEWGYACRLGDVTRMVAASL